MKLLCPICNEKLVKVDRQARCANNHSFDYAKQGYLNLLIKQSVDHGDNKEMVQARTQFLNSGGYAFLKQELVNLTKKYDSHVLCDLGCGEGYYTSGFQAEEKYGLQARMIHQRNMQLLLSSVFLWKMHPVILQSHALHHLQKMRLKEY